MACLRLVCAFASVTLLAGSPELAVDATTGDVAVAWHDARSSPTNTETDLYVTAKLDAETTFLPNVRVSQELSKEVSSTNSYGDYIGLAFHAGSIYPVSADNSNKTGDNPDDPPGPACGSEPCMDPYVATVFVPEPAAVNQFGAGAIALVGLASRRARMRAR